MSSQTFPGAILPPSFDASMEPDVPPHCLAAGLTPSERAQLDALAVARAVERGGYLARAGDRFHSVYLADRGLLKGVMVSVDGREQVVGFYLAGEPLGLEGFGSGVHGHDVVALEDSRLRAFPNDALARLGRTLPALEHNFNRMMSREIVRNQGWMQLLGSMCAEERVVRVLLSLSRRLKAVGLPPGHIDLNILRRDLASYIGVCIETMSRVLSGLQSRGVIALHGRGIEILDKVALESLVFADRRQQPMSKQRLRLAEPAQSAAVCGAPRAKRAA